MSDRVEISRGEPLELEMADGSVFEVPPVSCGQYRKALLLESKKGLGEETLVMRQCEILAGRSLTESLTLHEARQVVRAMVLDFFGIDPSEDQKLQDVLKKKALLDWAKRCKPGTKPA